MSLLDGPLGAVFGAAFAALFRDATLHKAQETDSGGGRFGVSTTDYPIKVTLDALASADRSVSGLPQTAMRMTILRAGVPVPVDLDDGVTVGGVAYRIIRVDTDPAQAGVSAVVVPA